MNDVLRVTHLTTHLEIGGAERTILDLCRFGPEKQLVVSLLDGPMRAVMQQAGIEVRVAGHPAGLGSHLAGADVVNIHWPAYEEHLLAAVAQAGKPMVSTAQWSTVFPPLPGPLICTSRHVFEQQRPNCTRRLLITNGVDTDLFRPAGKPLAPLEIIRVCHPHKCAEYFWPAVLSVLESCTGAVLTAVGGPAYRVGRVNAIGYRSDVHGPLSRAHIFAYAPQPDVGSFDLVVLEAMACGLPCVVSDVPCVNEAVEDGVSGFLTPFEDAGAFAEALRRLTRDAELREAMGREAARSARENFEIRDRAPLYSDAYARAYSEAELPSQAEAWRSLLGVESER